MMTEALIQDNALILQGKFQILSSVPQTSTEPLANIILVDAVDYTQLFFCMRKK